MMSNSDLNDDDVVISGLAFRLPGVQTYEKLSSMLFEGLPLRPKQKEQIPRGFHGDFPGPGNADDAANELDNVYFGMSMGVLVTSDQLHMKSLETAYEALLDAGLSPTEVRDFEHDVYVSCARSDGDLIAVNPRSSNRYFILGICKPLGPNRVSMAFNLHGSSSAIDSNYTGGFQALARGWNEIKQGRCDLAVVSTSNFILNATITNQINHLGWLSKDGKTCPFDENASGYQRTEATVTYILQRAKYARRVYAKLKHVICETGESSIATSITPSKESWVKLLKKAYEDGKINKDQIKYIEAHGIGIKEWDTSELNAFAEIFGDNRVTPLAVGSVKSNLGNTESAGDFVSILKAIISLENRKVPANLNFKSPNRAVPGLINGKLQVVDKNIDLPDGALIAVSGYSYGNSYGHCILEGFNKPKSVASHKFPKLVPISARMIDLLPEIMHQVEIASHDNDFLNLTTQVFSQKIDKHLARGYAIFTDGSKPITGQEALNEEGRPLWFVFSGMGSQWQGMGKSFMEMPITKAAIQRCHDILLPRGIDLIDVLLTDRPDVFEDNINSFVAINSIQIALVDLLNHLKIVPDGIIGHSLGEAGCAYADGCMNLEEAILASYARGVAVKKANLEKGAMAAIGMGHSQIKDDLPENVYVACHNSSSSCTISGLELNVCEYVKKLQASGVFAKIVPVGRTGFHSKLIAPAKSYLYELLNEAIKNPRLRSKKWISTSVPEADWNKDEALYASPAYFTNNFLKPVLFEEACKHIPENAILLEVAPHGLLQSIMKRSLPKSENISLASRTAPDNLIFLLQGIGKLYLNGLEPEISSLYPEPDYPVPPKTKSLHCLAAWCRNLRERNCVETTKSVMNLRHLVSRTNNVLDEHFLRGKQTIPFSYYPLFLWNALYQAEPQSLTQNLRLSDMRIYDPFAISIERDIEVDGFAFNYSKLIEITKDNKLLASGYASKLEGKITTLGSINQPAQVLLSLKKEEIYDHLSRQGYNLAKSMQFLHSVEWTSQGKSMGF